MELNHKVIFLIQTFPSQKNGVPFMMYSDKYSQSNCIAECNFLVAAQECGCIPWNYPRLNISANAPPHCDYKGQECFNHQVFLF